MLDIGLITKALIALAIVGILAALGYHLEQVGETRMEAVYLRRDRDRAAQAVAETAARAAQTRKAEADHGAAMSVVVGNYIATLNENQRLKDEQKPAVDPAFARGLYYNARGGAGGAADVPRADAGTGGGNEAGTGGTRRLDYVAQFLRSEAERASDAVKRRDAKITWLQDLLRTAEKTCPPPK